MSQFGYLPIFDQPFMEFALEEGVLYLPCGTIPTALIEFTGPAGEVKTQVTVLTPGAPPLSWTVLLSSAEAQEVFAEGAHRLNRTHTPPKPVSFDSELLPPDLS